jgi:hypothetical protein
LEVEPATFTELMVPTYDPKALVKLTAEFNVAVTEDSVMKVLTATGWNSPVVPETSVKMLLKVELAPMLAVELPTPMIAPAKVPSIVVAAEAAVGAAMAAAERRAKTGMRMISPKSVGFRAVPAGCLMPIY